MILPPELTQIADTNLARSVERLYEQIGTLEGTLSTCQADLVSAQGELNRLSGLDTQIKKQDDRIRRLVTVAPVIEEPETE